MNVNWDAVGAVAELLGAGGVIVTLAYLAVQIRVNARALRNQATRDSQEFITTACLPLIEDAEVAEIYVRGLACFDDLTEVEKVRFHYLCTQRVHAASASHALASTDAGHAGTKSMRTWVERMMRSAGFRQWWVERGQYVVDAAFLKISQEVLESVEADLAEREASPGIGATYRPSTLKGG